MSKQYFVISKKIYLYKHSISIILQILSLAIMLISIITLVLLFFLKDISYEYFFKDILNESTFNEIVNDYKYPLLLIMLIPFSLLITWFSTILGIDAERKRSIYILSIMLEREDIGTLEEPIKEIIARGKFLYPDESKYERLATRYSQYLKKGKYNEKFEVRIK